MKTLLLTAGVWPTKEQACEKMWLFMKSCWKYGHRPELYGVGKGFPGYKTMMLDYQYEYLKTIPSDYTHVLFEDGWDSLMLSDMNEIETKYRTMGSPDMLVSAYFGLGNVSDMAPYKGMFDETKYYRYPNRGGYIGRREYVVEMFKQMVKLPRQTGDDCHNWYDLWASGWRPMLDSRCEIFQVTEEHCEVVTIDGDKSRPRLMNRKTASLPSICHFSGGYTSSDTGKDERIKPWAEKLQII